MSTGLAENLQRDLVARLDHAYPSFAGYWVVMVNDVNGVVQVINTMLSGRWGFLMLTSKIDPEGRKVVMLAGELLERYHVSRAKYVDLQTLRDLPRDQRHEMIADHG